MRGYHRLGAAIIVLFSFQNGFSQDFVPFKKRYNRLVQGVSLHMESSRLYFALPHKERLTVMYNITNDTVPRLAIYSSSQKPTGTWSEPELFNFSGRYKDYEPTISPNGKVMFFNSNRPLSGSKIESKNNIWYSRLENETWQEPKSLQHINTNEFEESYASMASNSKLIYSKEVVVNGNSEYHLFETYFDGVYTKNGKRIVFPNFQFEASDPHISSDGDYLVFTGFHSSNWNNTCNLYISFLKDGSWAQPQPLIELNSMGPDFSPFVSADDNYIFYRKSYQFLRFPFEKILDKYR